MRRQRTKARPALMKQLSALQQETEQQESKKNESEHAAEKVGISDEGVLEEEALGGELERESFAAAAVDAITEELAVSPTPETEMLTEVITMVSDAETNNVIISNHDESAHDSDENKETDDITQNAELVVEEAAKLTKNEQTQEMKPGELREVLPVEVTLDTSPSEPTPIDAALLQCADAVVEAKRVLPAGELESVDAAVTLCLDVIAKEAIDKLNGVRGRSRLALWQDKARCTPEKAQAEPVAQPMASALDGACAEMKAACTEPVAQHMPKQAATVKQMSKAAQRKQSAQQKKSEFVPPAPKPRNCTQEEVNHSPPSPAAPESKDDCSTKWHPYLDQEHTELPPASKVKVTKPSGKTVHCSAQPNVQPNSSLPRPNTKDCGFVPPAPKPRNATRKRAEPTK